MVTVVAEVSLVTKVVMATVNLLQVSAIYDHDLLANIYDRVCPVRFVWALLSPFQVLSRFN